MIGRANDVEYGLCASVWSENSGVTHRVAQAIDVSSQYTVVVVGFRVPSKTAPVFHKFIFMHCLLWTYCLALLSTLMHYNVHLHFSLEK